MSATQWQNTAKAKAILSGLSASDFVSCTRIAPLGSEADRLNERIQTIKGDTDRGDDAVKSLHKIRCAAVTAEVGYDWEAITTPCDEGGREETAAWFACFNQTIDAETVIQDHLNRDGLLAQKEAA